MAEVVIAQRDIYTQAPAASPAVYDKLGRFENITFLGTIATVEGSADGTTYADITALGTALVSAIVFKGVAFKFYRVTGTGMISVMAN
jgi:hypothetical protein